MLVQKLLSRLLGGNRKQESVPDGPKWRPVAPVQIQVAPPDAPRSEGTPRYPPIDAGIQVSGVEDVLASQGDLILLLKRNLGISNQEFDRKYLGPIRRVAEWVNLLPATRDKHHTGAGGLFRFSVTMAVRAAQSAEGRIFAASEGVERRRATETTWRHAAFLTGLTCELFRPMTEMLVVDESGKQWNAYLGSLSQWAADQGVSRYFVRWHQRDDVRSSANAMSSFAVTAILGREVLAEIDAVSPKIVETIYGVASGAITTADNNTLAALIADVRRRTIERDHQIAPTTYGKLTTGAHLEPYFLDAMRTLLRNGVWQVNAKGARCHWGADGFYVAWRIGSDELLKHLAHQKIGGVPSERETLAEMLGKSGIITTAPDGSWIHMVHPAIGGSSPMPAIRITSPNALLGTLEVKPVDHALKASMVKPQAPNNTSIDSAKSVSTTPDVTTSVKSQKGELKTETPEVVDGGVQATKSNGFTKPDPETGEITPVTVPNVGVPAINEGDEDKKTSKKQALGEGAVSAEQKRQVGAAKKSKEGIPVVDDVGDVSISDFNKDLLLELGSPVCREVAQWREMWNRGQRPSEFLRTDQGLAVSYILLQDGALSFAKVVDTLHENGHIETSMRDGKPRKLSMVPFAKGPQMGLVLRTSFLRKAGFQYE